MSISTSSVQLPVLKLPQTVVIGHDAMPPAMREHIMPGKAADLWDPRTHRHGLQKLLDMKRMRALGPKGLAKALFHLWEYRRFSNAMRESLEENATPDTLVRAVFDARGWDHLPMEADLARIEKLDGIVDAGEISEPSCIEEVDEAFDKGGFVFNFFKEHLGVVLPQPMVQTVNFNADVTFTGWENAFFLPLEIGAKMVIYGKGDGRLFHSPTKAIDIIAHEFGHAFSDTVYPEKFPYYYQPGAINEHISDVIGICVKAKYEKELKQKDGGDLTGPYPDNFWLLGAGWMTRPDMGIRHMLRPGQGYNHSDYGRDQQPDHMRKFRVTPFDAGGVHINSGILNRAFALFAQSVGGDCFDIPLKVWLKAISIVRTEPSFRDFGEALWEAAREMDKCWDMRGQNLKAKMQQALDAVGVLDYVVVGKNVAPVNRAVAHT